MTNILHNCVDSLSVIRDGHKPFSRTIGDALNDLARRSIADAFTRDTLEDMRLDRRRNHQMGGKCDNCGHDGLLSPVEWHDGYDVVTFNICRKCRP